MKSAAVAAAGDWSRLVRTLETCALYVLLLIVAMRPLLSETYDSALNSIARVIGGGESPSPATTAGFDLAIWLAATAGVVAMALRRQRWRWTGLEPGWVVLLVAAVISTWGASNKRLATNASCDWLSALALAMVLANLLRNRRQVLLVLAVVAASGLASAAKCGTQLAWEFRETQQNYEKARQSFWSEQGIALDDPRVELFERRLKAQEASGFMSYSNAEAAGLALAGFAALALSCMTGRSKGVKAVCVAIAVVLFVAIVPTGSKGGFLAMLVGVCGWIVLSRIEEVLRRHWRWAWIVGWVVVVGGSAAVIGHGLAHGELPGESLRFRWDYWRVTSRIIAERPWTGVGALNFDRAYMQYKPVQYPEEIRDPHNCILSVTAQWGIIGGVGAMIALLGASAVAAKRWGQIRIDARAQADLQVEDKRGLSLWIVAVPVGFMLFRLWILRGWWMTSVEGAAATFFDLGLYGLVWVIGFSLIVWLIGEGTGEDRYRLACFWGCAAFLLHNTIEFSLFVPGTLTAFVAMGAVLLGPGASDRPPGAEVREHGWPLAGVCLAGLLAVIGLVAVPVERCASYLDQAREAAAIGSQDAAHLYRAAAAADRLDPTPLMELASWIVRTRQPTTMEAALRFLAEAERRDPLDRSIYRLRWQILYERYQATRAPADLMGAIVACEKGLSLYPNSPDDHVDLARLLERAAKDLASEPPAQAGGRDWRADAIAQYRKALELDAARPSYEIRRWSKERRQRVEEELAQLRGRAGSKAAD
jgi:hypothetical protein